MFPGKGGQLRGANPIGPTTASAGLQGTQSYCHGIDCTAGIGAI